MAVMAMKNVISAVNDRTEIKIYKDGHMVAKGNWFQDQILEYAAEKNGRSGLRWSLQQVQGNNFTIKKGDCEQ